MKNPLEKFKHRNIAKVATAYAVVGWLMLQMTEIILPTFNAPQWIAQTIIFVVIMGFPIALLIAWASELKSIESSGPSKLSLESEAARVEVPKSLSYGVGIIGISIIGLFAFYVSTSLFEVSNPNENTSTPLIVDSNTRMRPSIKNRILLGDTCCRAWGSKSDIAISPDGRWVVYTDFTPPEMSIKILDTTSFDSAREIDTLLMAPSEGYPTFSEDGRWVYYAQNAALKRARVEGGTPQVVISEEVGGSGFSVRGQSVAYFNTSSQALEIFDIGTGESRQVLENNGSVNATYTWPQFVPQTNKILATLGTRGTYANARVDLIDLDSGEIRNVVPLGFNARYASSGHVIFARGDSLWALPVRGASLEAAGDAVPIIFDLEIYEQFANVGYSLSNEGRLIYVSGAIDSSSGQFAPVFVSSSGIERALPIEAGRYGSPQFSPDERYLSLTRNSAQGSDVWLFNFEGQTLERRTFDDISSRAVWTSAGDRLVYRCGVDICSVASNGTGSSAPILEEFPQSFPNQELNDGTLLISAGNPSETFVANASQKAENIIERLELAPPNSNTGFMRISPDGNWLAYQSQETGRLEVFVRPFPDTGGGKWQVSRNGGSFPLWDKSSNRLFYWDSYQDAAMASTFEFSEQGGSSMSISFGTPELLFSGNGRFATTTWPYWDYSPSSDEFVIIKPEISTQDILSSQTQLFVIENWFDELNPQTSAKSLED